MVVSSLTAQTATVSLFKEGKPTGQSKKVELHAGKNVVTFEQNIDQKGFFRYSATLDAPEDTIPGKQQGGRLCLGGRQADGAVCGRQSCPDRVSAQIAARAEHQRRVCQPRSHADLAAALQPYDSVFLSNVPASALSTRR